MWKVGQRVAERRRCLLMDQCEERRVIKLLRSSSGGRRLSSDDLRISEEYRIEGFWKFKNKVKTMNI